MTTQHQHTKATIRIPGASRIFARVGDQPTLDMRRVASPRQVVSPVVNFCDQAASAKQFHREILGRPVVMLPDDAETMPRIAISDFGLLFDQELNEDELELSEGPVPAPMVGLPAFQSGEWTVPQADVVVRAQGSSPDLQPVVQVPQRRLGSELKFIAMGTFLLSIGSQFLLGTLF